MKYDIVILTKKDFYEPANPDWYVKQVLTEDSILQKALEDKGLKVTRTYWDNPDFEWSDTKAVLFRTIWDYFHRFDEFKKWLNTVKKKTRLINSEEIIYYNIDKHYLNDLSSKGINIPETLFIEKGCTERLVDLFREKEYKKAVLKPAVSGAGRHTYLIDESNITEYENIFMELIQFESMMLQDYQRNITTKGEVALMIFGGEFTHAVLKKAKEGDFRVQDDFGGSVHNYGPTIEEIEFAKNVVSKIEPYPLYARVDIIWDNYDKPAVSELELIEPELWFRFHPPAADFFAEVIKKEIV